MARWPTAGGRKLPMMGGLILYVLASLAVRWLATSRP